VIWLWFRNLYTKTGTAPSYMETREYTGEEEAQLQPFLEGLTEHRTDPQRPSAVLLACVPDNSVVAWSRPVLGQFEMQLGQVSPSDREPWMDDLQQALNIAAAIRW
jgi:hypothetical protein